MIIEVIDPGLNPLIFLGGIGVILLGALLIFLGIWLDSQGGDGSGPGAPGLALVLMAVIFTPTVAFSAYAGAKDAAAMAALEEAGFSHVAVDGSEVTAESEDGTYFEGKLLHLGGNDWQLVEYVEVEK